MPFKLSLVILIFLSLLTGALLVLLASSLMGPPAGTGGAYALLALDESWPDREIRGRLNQEGVISESSQWVFLDDFDGLSRIPLDEYPARISPFDPRNDGYAERLRSFFIREGKRLFFIPLRRSFFGNGAGELEKQLGSSLGDIPFQLEYLGPSRPVWLYVILLTAAGFGALGLSRRFALIPCLFPLGCLSLAGLSGLALAAVLIGLGELFFAPGEEFFLFLRYRKTRPGSGNFKKRFPGDVLSPFRACWLLGPVFLGAFVLISLMGRVHPLAALGVFAGFTGTFFFSLWVFSRRGETQGHIRFSPVSIRKIPVKNLSFSRIMLPFALSSLAAAVLFPLFPGPAPGGESSLGEAENLIPDKGEYEKHLAFQASFSYRPLGRAPEDFEQEPRGPFRYVLGDDGLITEEGGDFSLSGNDQGDIPPFPLEDLTAFLKGGGKVSPGEGALFTPADLVSVLIMFLFSLPALIRPDRGDKTRKKRLLYRLLYKYKEKGIAA